MLVEATVTIRAVCHCCGGSGKCPASLDGGKTLTEITCPECKGEGVSEQQVGLRELAALLLPHITEARLREAESVVSPVFQRVEAHRASWHGGPIEEAEVGDAE